MAGERERQRQREAEKQRDRETETDIERERERERNRERKYPFLFPVLPSWSNPTKSQRATCWCSVYYSDLSHELSQPPYCHQAIA